MRLKETITKEDVDQVGRNAEPPKPGVYTAKIDEINFGYSRNQDGSQDKDRPRYEVIYRITEGNHSGFPLWDYLSMSDAAKWKRTEFLVATGIVDPKAVKKSKKVDVNMEDLVGKTVTIRVVAGKDLEGDYRPRVGTVLPLADEDAEEGEDEEVDEDADEEEIGEDEDEDEDDEDWEEDDEDDDDEPPYDPEDIDKMKGSELKAVVTELNDEYGYEIEIPKGTKVKEVKELIKSALTGEEDDEDDDDVPF